jgi:hypothetical protein
MFSSPWVVIPIAVVLALFVLYVATMLLLIVFAQYFARGAADDADPVEQPIRDDRAAGFERALGRSRDAAYEATRPRGAGLTRRTG